MAFNSNLSWFKPLVDISERALLPVHWLAMIPSRLDDWAQSTFFSRSELETENSRLNQENLVHRAQLQRMGELAAENLRLRLLLNATELLGVIGPGENSLYSLIKLSLITQSFLSLSIFK